MPRTLLVLALALQAPAAVRFDSNRAWEHLRQLVAIGPRPSGSAALDETRRYLKGQLAATGLPVSEQMWEARTPTGSVRMVNLIATIAGRSKDRIVIAGHYDTKRFREFRFVGANDGGSSAAFLLELGRVLKLRKNPLTLELLFLDGEEAVIEWEGTDHTYGSRHYVEEAKQNRSLMSLKAFVLIDMIGDRDLRIRRDLNSTRWLTDLFWDTARRKGLAGYFSSETTQIEDD